MSERKKEIDEKVIQELLKSETIIKIYDECINKDISFEDWVRKTYFDLKAPHVVELPEIYDLVPKPKLYLFKKYPKHVGYSKLHTCRMYLRTFFERLMFKFWPGYGSKFSDGIVKDGVDELDDIWVARW